MKFLKRQYKVTPRQNITVATFPSTVKDMSLVRTSDSDSSTSFTVRETEHVFGKSLRFLSRHGRLRVSDAGSWGGILGFVWHWLGPSWEEKQFFSVGIWPALFHWSAVIVKTPDFLGLQGALQEKAEDLQVKLLNVVSTSFKSRYILSFGNLWD